MNKKILLLCAGLLFVTAASAATILFSGGTVDDPVVVLSQGGTVLHEIDLKDVEEPLTFHITNYEGGENTVRIEPGKVCMESASCPDQICVNQGYIEDGSVPIVCLPNQFIIEIRGGESALDAATH